MNANHKKFMLESNQIEGEDRINPDDLDALSLILNSEICESLVSQVHRILGEYLNVDWTGRYRACRVRVGQYIPPEPYMVPGLMTNYFKILPSLNSWEAHNEFEKIHPFQDLNGRVGRLIWLNRALQEGYDFSIPFLQMYYYQTLKNQNE